MSMKYEQLDVCVLQSAMSRAVLVTIFSLKYDIDPFFCSAIVSLATLVSMSSIAVLFFLLK
jgi:predicted permease